MIKFVLLLPVYLFELLFLLYIGLIVWIISELFDRLFGLFDRVL